MSGDNKQKANRANSIESRSMVVGNIFTIRKLTMEVGHAEQLQAIVLVPIVGTRWRCSSDQPLRMC